MKFLRKNNDNLFGDFAGDDEYYRGGDLNEKDNAGEEAFAAPSGALHTRVSPRFRLLQKIRGFGDGGS